VGAAVGCLAGADRTPLDRRRRTRTRGVGDQFLGEHSRHLLTIRDGKAECVPTDRSPDLSMDIRDLARSTSAAPPPACSCVPGASTRTTQTPAPPPTPSSAPSAPRTACTGSDHKVQLRPGPLSQGKWWDDVPGCLRRSVRRDAFIRAILQSGKIFISMAVVSVSASAPSRYASVRRRTAMGLTCASRQPRTPADIG